MKEMTMPSTYTVLNEVEMEETEGGNYQEKFNYKAGVAYQTFTSRRAMSLALAGGRFFALETIFPGKEKLSRAVYLQWADAYGAAADKVSPYKKTNRTVKGSYNWDKNYYLTIDMKISLI